MAFGFWFMMLAFVMCALAVAWAVGGSILMAVILIRESWAESTVRINAKKDKSY